MDRLRGIASPAASIRPAPHPSPIPAPGGTRGGGGEGPPNPLTRHRRSPESPPAPSRGTRGRHALRPQEHRPPRVAQVLLVTIRAPAPEHLQHQLGRPSLLQRQRTPDTERVRGHPDPCQRRLSWPTHGLNRNTRLPDYYFQRALDSMYFSPELFLHKLCGPVHVFPLVIAKSNFCESFATAGSRGQQLLLQFQQLRRRPWFQAAPRKGAATRTS